MGMPQALNEAIEAEAAALPAHSIAQAAAELGRDYSGVGSASAGRLASPQARIAYLIARMPAIFEVNCAVMAELARLRPGLEIRSVLDLGSGPGTATLAAQQICGPLQAATMVDSHAGWIDLRARLLTAADPRLASAARPVSADLRHPVELNPHDLVIISYALGEMDQAVARRLIDRAWAWARSAVVVVEPGTPRGFGAIAAARDALIGAQACIVAPCTHARRCPLTQRNDWCHFDIRVARTRRQQHIKAANLPFEIEKYSYVIAAKSVEASDLGAARIIKHPLKKSGHVILDLCTAKAAIERIVVSRREKGPYRQARAARWGELWTSGEDTQSFSGPTV
jgi:ribosomal protein RSM22 (predicted rRNA methylase)